MIRFATYNIQKSIGADLRRDPRRILDVISEFDPDVIALQEADRRFADRRATLSPELIAERTDLVPIAVAMHAGGIGWHGNAILARRGYEVVARRRLELPKLEPRGAVAAVIATPEGEVEAVACHLSLLGRFRRRQVAHIVSGLHAAASRRPTVILGDLNEWLPRSASLRAFAPGFEAAPTGPSYPAPRPVAALDRIFHGPEFRVERAGVHRSRLARIASDHLPAWADLDLRG